MTAVAAIYRAGLRQLISGKRVWGLLALATLPAVVTYLGGRNFTASRAFDFFHEAPLFMTVIIVIPVVCLIIGSAALGEERRGNTLSFLVLRPIRRVMITAAKLAAAWSVSFGIVAAGWIVNIVALAISGGGASPLVPGLFLIALNTLLYCGVFVALGYITDRAVFIGLAYVFVWENGLAGFIEALSPLSIWRVGMSAYIAMVDGLPSEILDVLGSVQPGAFGAFAKTAVVAALFSSFTAGLLRARDVT